MNEVYVIIVCDRHIDVFTEVYANKEAAIKRAWELANEYSAPHHNTFEEEHEGWEIYIGWGVEEDCVYIEKNEVK